MFVCLAEGEGYLGRGNHMGGTDTVPMMGSGERAVIYKSSCRVGNGEGVGDTTDKAGLFGGTGWKCRNVD